MGFLPPEDERVKATVLAIADELTKDDLVLRYRVEATDTGFDGEEGTFTICSFWLVTAVAMVGETKRAYTLCQKLLSFAGPLLLYAEEIDTTTGQHLGNFPQAFTHLALIEAVSLLISLEPEGTTSPSPSDQRASAGAAGRQARTQLRCDDRGCQPTTSDARLAVTLGDCCPRRP
jgi:alpha,alpha-trehalase